MRLLASFLPVSCQRTKMLHCLISGGKDELLSAGDDYCVKRWDIRTPVNDLEPDMFCSNLISFMYEEYLTIGKALLLLCFLYIEGTVWVSQVNQLHFYSFVLQTLHHIFLSFPFQNLVLPEICHPKGSLCATEALLI